MILSTSHVADMLRDDLLFHARQLRISLPSKISVPRLKVLLRARLQGGDVELSPSPDVPSASPSQQLPNENPAPSASSSQQVPDEIPRMSSSELAAAQVRLWKKLEVGDYF